MSTLITARLNETIQQDQNLIYCATVNLTWNELSNFVNGEITFKQYNETVDFLNRKSFTKNMLDEKCYIAYADLVSNGIVDKIIHNLRERFGETSKFDFSNLNPSDILAYSFLLKTLTFENKFENIEQLYFKSKDVVKAFGLKKVNKNTEKKLLDQVNVLYYTNEDDFSIELKTQSDTIVLIKTPHISSMEDMIKKNESIKHSTTRLEINETLIIPKIEFDLQHQFEEMIGQTVLVNGKIIDYYIGEAVQFIKFNLNEEGAKLRSEMAITMRGFSLEKSRQFVFNKPFLIYLKEKDQPYFAAWISNTEILKK